MLVQQGLQVVLKDGDGQHDGGPDADPQTLQQQLATRAHRPAALAHRQLWQLQPQQQVGATALRQLRK